MAWPDGGTNEVVKTVGATARDHSTILAWEAETDEDCTAGWGAGDYSAACSPVGDCYDDADFSERAYPNGATTSENYYRTLTVHEGQRHSGKGGDGATLTDDNLGALAIRDKYFVFEWFILGGTRGEFGPYYCPENSRIMVRNCVSVGTGAYAFYADQPGAGSLTYLRNCSATGFSTYGARKYTYTQNVSVYAANAYLVRDSECTNVIACGGTSGCFYFCTGDYNIGSDATAPGANSVDNIAGADLFVNVASDLHLKSGTTDAAGAGSDLSASFTDDIDGDTRSDWDIGADEYDSGGGGLAADIILTMWMKRRKYSLIER